MKITIIVRKFPPKWLAGTELAASNIAKYLKKNDHDVHVVTSFDKEVANQNIDELFKVYRISGSKLRLFGYLIFSLRIFWAIKKINPEIIHVQGLYMSLPAFLSKKILKIPYVITGQGSDVYTSWPYKNLISKLGLNNSKLSIALTEDMKKEMQKLTNKRIEVIPNGIDVKKFDLIKCESRKKLGLDNKGEIILFVGRLEPVKGLKYLIEAIGNIKDSKHNLKLILVGAGKDELKLKMLVKKLSLDKKISFIGEVPNEKIPEYMTASDIFVLPSLSEGFPVVLLEAMASGLPIITTNIRGLSEIIHEGDNGFLVKPKNSNQIADKIKLILNDETIQKKFYIENKKKSCSYDWKNIVKRLELIYNLK